MPQVDGSGLKPHRFTSVHNSAEMDTELPEGPEDTTTGTCSEMAEEELVTAQTWGFPGKGPVGVEVGTRGEAEQ